MKIDIKDFCVTEGGKVKLKKWPTQVDPYYESRKDYKKNLEDHIAKLKKRQGLLYASSQYALLLIFQALDAGGKDGAIKHVMSGVNPQGCQVYSFKQPSAEELAHDFLWRTTRCLPARGNIGIFNRSYYEEVLVVRVHPEILKKQNLPPEEMQDKKFWHRRYCSILDLEKHLHRNGTCIVKFFLHISKEEQRRRFLSRLDDSEKNWKMSRSDLAERGHWKEYQRAYEDCLAATSTKTAPWYIVPADDKENARLIVSQVILDTIDKLKISYPHPNPARRKELRVVRKLLEK